MLRPTALPALLPAFLAAALMSGGCADGGGSYLGNRAEVEELIRHFHAIELTPQQEAVRTAALEPLPAPCCARFSAATCCCTCNLARATWGLAEHLIADKRLAADAVRAEVAAFHRAVNPDGFSGGACFTGGCDRPFHDDGCGGMVDGRLRY